MQEVIGYIRDANVMWLQSWVGNRLGHMTFVDDFEQLRGLRNKIILVDMREANFRFDDIRDLIAAKNYMVFMDPFEVESPYFMDLLRDMPEARQFPTLIAGENHHQFHCNLDSCWFISSTDVNVLHAQLYTTQQYRDKKQKPYKFLYLNGNDRWHRNHLWHSLNQRGLVDQSLWSYLNYRFTAQPEAGNQPIPTRLLSKQYERYHTDPDQVQPEMQQDQTEIKEEWHKFYAIDDIKEMAIDPRNYKRFMYKFWHAVFLEGVIVPNQYIDTYFSVVTESETQNHTCFASEKIYKPILTGHPFIALASPGFYKYLRDRGFRTFDGIIDESFDLEPDVEKRIGMIAREIERLCNQDLPTLIEQTKSICDHNQQHLIANRSKMFLEVHHRLDQFFSEIFLRAEHYFQQ